MSKAEPCPFCGHDKVVIEIDRKYYRLSCYVCSCKGPKADSYEQAFFRWNTRSLNRKEANHEHSEKSLAEHGFKLVK